MTHEELATRLLKAEDALSELMAEHRALQRSHDELDELCAKMVRDVHRLKQPRAPLDAATGPNP